MTFAEILEAVDELPLQDQAELLHILEKRLQEQQRLALIQDVRTARQEFAQGQCQPVTVADLMEEILS